MQIIIKENLFTITTKGGVEQCLDFRNRDVEVEVVRLDDANRLLNGARH